MNFFENNLVELINFEEELDRNVADLASGDLDYAILMDRVLEVREIIEEFKKIHVGLVKQDMLVKQLAEVKL